MRKYIIATHGYMAYGINTTLNMLIGEQENLTVVNAYTDECKDPVPEFEKIIEENPDDVVDEILAVEEIDPADIDGTEVFQFNELTTVYTVDGQELTAATFQMDNGFEGMIVDVDGDGVFDDMATLDGYSVGQAPLLTVDDVEMELNPSTEYLAQNDDIDHTLTDDTYMDDMIDLA